MTGSADTSGDQSSGDTSPADVVIEDDRWIDAGLDRMAAAAVSATARHLGLGSVEVVVMGCDDDRIAALNDEFREKPRPTNVLSWPTVQQPARQPGDLPALPFHDASEMAELGDIAISFDTCTREAAEQGKKFSDHVTHLLVHATLHLIGFDHENDADAETMEDTERSVLATLGIPDPYQGN